MRWEIAWSDFFRVMVPLFSAQLFLMVLAYFTLVRRQMKREYPFYVAFILSFVLYLCGPILRSLPLNIPAYLWLYVRSFFLFGVGFPALLVALSIQSGLKISRKKGIAPFVVGGLWVLGFLILCDQFYAELGVLKQAGLIFDVTKTMLRFFQIGGVVMLLIIPCIGLLIRRTAHKKPRPFIYGALYFGLFMAYGIAAENFQVFYAGSSFCALAWAWAVFCDIRELNRKQEQHHEHQKTLAAAQYASGSAVGEISVSEIYPVQFDESYPFADREILLELIRTDRIDLIKPATEKLLAELHHFCGGTLALYKARVRELLFLLVDAAVFADGNPTELIPRLEEKGRRIDRCADRIEISELICAEAVALAKIIADSRDEPSDMLVLRAQSFMNENYQQDCGIDEIAAKLNVSRSGLTKAFRKSTGQTVNQYLTEIRMEKAKRMLLSKSVTETAFAVGFNNSNYFSTVFKKQTGQTPKQFHNSFKAE
ncbi:helix-turn-helix domain-containing protein [Pontiella sulfatireligans]|uniref:HTH-type transcriptional regulator YesS n=1 Tax=Pontiella sulfatireligans TaxID=2750658 RepID=A0A6C2ULU0_9BACT|nr:helix-turn-helix domain-containing protein [Pontiella sulfatireligans]VGO20397.1 HTH-type transcriptional regulator YesS [Pontiella sulfatireligans]